MNSSITKIKYQNEFSNIHYEKMRNFHNRNQKAKKIVIILSDYLKYNTASMEVLDIGSSTGFVTRELSKYFYKITGIDIDKKAIKYAKKNNNANNVKYVIQDCHKLKFKNNSFDIVICSHIYEHVFNPQKMMDEIYRVLKKGGVCYFAAGNKLRLIEGHYSVPLLSIMPKCLSDFIVKKFFKQEYFENHLFCWQLKKLVRKFKVIDYTKIIIAQPEKYYASEMIKRGTVKQEITIKLMDILYFMIPTYIWLLKK